jgi:serine/threonine protein kinase
VKLVEHTLTGECFAMKCLDKRRIKEAGSEHTIKSEITVMRALDSPFVVKLVKPLRDRAQIYLLMELVLGGELLKVRSVT